MVAVVLMVVDKVFVDVAVFCYLLMFVVCAVANCVGAEAVVATPSAVVVV